MRPLFATSVALLIVGLRAPLHAVPPPDPFAGDDVVEVDPIDAAEVLIEVDILEEGVPVEIVGGVVVAAEPEEDEPAAGAGERDAPPLIVVEGAVDAAGRPALFGARAGGVVKAGEEGEAEADGEGEEGEEEEEVEPATPGESILKDLDFDPTDKGYQEKIAGLFMTADELKAVREQIVALDAEDFRERNEASKQLAMVEAPVEHLLGAARKDAGVEMSRRIQSILNVRVKQRRLDALYHAAGKVAAEGTEGYVDPLLVMADTLDVQSHWELLRMFERAVAKSAREQDRERLEAALAGDSVTSREIAAFALGYSFADKPPASGAPDPRKGDDGSKGAYLRGRVAAGDRAAAEGLRELLGSDEVRVRHEAGLLLRAMFDRDFGYAAYDPQPAREKAAERWANFLGSGDGAGEIDPVLLGVGARGDFEVLVGKRPDKDGAILSFTTSGKKVGRHELAAAMGGVNPSRIVFEPRSGMILASGGGDEDGRVAVLSAEGVELWNASGIPAGGGAALLPGGRLLVAVGSEVEELDVTGTRVAVWKLESNIRSFGSLREGRFLCAHPEDGSVAEYGSDGKQLWKAEGFNNPTRVDRLPNGNLLVVASTSKDAGEQAEGDNNNNNSERQIGLIETTPDGGTVIGRIQPKSVRTITSAARLPNGNTLVGTEKGLAEYTPEGYAVKVWIKSSISSLHVR